MGQSFEYQNLLTGTRSAGGFANVAHGDNLIPRVTLAAAPGGWAYALSNATDKEKFAISRETFRLRHGVPYSLSLWAAVTGNMASMDIFVLAYGTSDDGWVAAGRSVIAPASGGGWLSWGFSLPEASREDWDYYLRFDNNGSKDGKESTLWIADPMLCEGTEPRAWAPASGEVWP